jgi:hypothetical protein
LLTLGFSVRLMAVVPVIPGGGGGDTNAGVELDSWSFADTNYWTSDQGYYPISFTNIAVSYICLAICGNSWRSSKHKRARVPGKKCR